MAMIIAKGCAMAKKEKFDRAGYTAITSKVGVEFEERVVSRLLDNKKLGISEDHVFRSKAAGGKVLAVYVKTSKLKREIEKNEGLCNTLINMDAELADIQAVRRTFSMRSDTIRSEPRKVDDYIDKTKKNKNTFKKPRYQEEETDYKKRLKVAGIGVGIAGIAATGMLTGRAINASGRMMQNVADGIVEATDIDYSGKRRDGLDRQTEVVAGKKPPPRRIQKQVEENKKTFEEKENEREKQREEEKKDQSPNR
jgi:hypothetical protein